MNGQHIWLSSIENCVFAKKIWCLFNECKSAVWRNPIEHYKDHPTPKPVKLMERLIEASSNVGDTVLDPCMAAVIGVAAKQCGRNFIGDPEMNKEYFELTEERINSKSESILFYVKPIAYSYRP